MFTTLMPALKRRLHGRDELRPEDGLEDDPVVLLRLHQRLQLLELLVRVVRGVEDGDAAGALRLGDRLGRREHRRVVAVRDRERQVRDLRLAPLYADAAPVAPQRSRGDGAASSDDRGGRRRLGERGSCFTSRGLLVGDSAPRLDVAARVYDC